MDPFEKLLEYLNDYKVVICKQCHFGIVPSQVEGHIRVQHRQIQAKERQSIIEQVENIPDIARTPGDVQYASASSPPIPGLLVYRDGLQCRNPRATSGCQYVCRHYKVM